MVRNQNVRGESSRRKVVGATYSMVEPSHKFVFVQKNQRRDEDSPSHAKARARWRAGSGRQGGFFTARSHSRCAKVFQHTYMQPPLPSPP